MTPSVLVVIPARAGSKGLPGKNVRLCAGKPLMVWSIEHGLTLPGAEVVVSTDDTDYACYAAIAGAYPLTRPAELATDAAKTDDVLIHAAKALPGAEYVALLQPTVPVRRHGLLAECVARAVETGADSVLTAYPLHFVWWHESAYTYDMRTGREGPPLWASQCPRRPMRQDMQARELMWHEDGSVYVTRTAYLLEHGCRIGGHIEVVETEPTVDIDTERDLVVAEALLGFTEEAR